MSFSIENEMPDLIDTILNDYKKNRTIDQVETFYQPDSKIVSDILQKLVRIIFPGFHREANYRFYNVDSQMTVLLEDVMFNLNRQVGVALRQKDDFKDLDFSILSDEAGKICVEFFKRIPKIREYIQTDVEATFDGDPAAFNYNEIILCYPGLYAITVSRIAHELYQLNVPILPRMMTEEAHSKTGIDIHPGATIGKYFFIDHGTGIVIGETTIIGEHVKIYQGVTIGALSTRGGHVLTGVKRHPTIEDQVTIYSGASILGGETVIGKGCVIGGNTSITCSVAPNTKVSIKSQELTMKTMDAVEE